MDKIDYIEYSDDINVVLENKVSLFIETDNEIYTSAPLGGS